GQTAVPAQFMRHFSMRHFLFLGYGLRDWNLRVVLKTSGGRRPGIERGMRTKGRAAAGPGPSNFALLTWSRRSGWPAGSTYSTWTLTNSWNASARSRANGGPSHRRLPVQRVAALHRRGHRILLRSRARPRDNYF